MSKSSGGVASVESIEDAICDNRMFAERTFYCIANGAVNVRASTEGHKWRGKRLNHDKYICEMEKIA